MNSDLGKCKVGNFLLMKQYYSFYNNCVFLVFKIDPWSDICCLYCFKHKTTLRYHVKEINSDIMWEMIGDESLPNK